MKTQSIINKLAKYGIALENEGSRYEAVVNGYVLTVRDQGGWASNVHIRRIGDEHNSMTDYFPGWFCHTIKAVVSGLDLPASPEGYTAIKAAKVKDAESVEVGPVVIEVKAPEVIEIEPIEIVEPAEPTESAEILTAVLEQRRELLEEKQARRQERYETLAAKNDRASAVAFEQSRRLSEAIPFGQPILIGHHSEGRDRRYRDGIWNKMGESVKLAQKADHYRGKLEALQGNCAISSDDPDAIQKLREKLADMEAKQATMKRINASIRKHFDPAESISENTFIIAIDTGISSDIIQKALTPNCFGRIGFERFELTNNNANIKRTKSRLAEIEQQHQAIQEAGEASITEYPDLGLKLVQENVLNRVQIVFDGKPESSIRDCLKRHGFRWAPSQGAWQRQLNRSGLSAAEMVVKALQA